MVAWMLGKDGMNLNFQIFQGVVLLLSIVVVGSFVRDKKTNYLEGGLLVLVYVTVAVAAWYYPNASLLRSDSESSERAFGA